MATIKRQKQKKPAGKKPVGKVVAAKSVSRETIVQDLLGKLGEQIFQKRRDKKMSLQDLHKASGGISYVLISKIERGLAQNVNISTLVAITTALSLDLSISLSEPQ